MPESAFQRSPKIIAIANQKGGVGKTTTSINLSAALAKLGRKVVLIDLDPQGNASTGLGIMPENRDATTYDLVLGETAFDEAVLMTDVENLGIIPATTDLSSADIEVMSNPRRSYLLRDRLRSEATSGLDYILLDCPPSLNVLTVNAMVAADSVLVPLQSEFFALEGLSQLMLTIREVRGRANPDLRIEGIALTMYDKRNNLSLQVEQDARDNLGDLVFKTVIPRNVRLSEAPSYAMSVLDYEPNSSGAEAYRRLADELISKES